jgi:hypothetical protein
MIRILFLTAVRNSNAKSAKRGIKREERNLESKRMKPTMITRNLNFKIRAQSMTTVQST